jgi:RsiW-degrading membrane proteinase PrsW (M82 family)
MDLIRTNSTGIQSVIPDQPPDNHHINVVWWLLYVLMYLLGCIVFIVSWHQFGNILFFPLIFSTAFFGYYIYRKWTKAGRINSQITLFSDLFRAFSQSYFGGGLFALVLEGLLSVLVIFAFANKSNLKTAMETNDFSSFKTNVWAHIYILFTAFIVAGCVEEYTKGFILQYTMKLYLPHTQFLYRQYIDTIVLFGVCVGLGFGTMEGVIYVCVYGGYQSFLVQFILWCIRAFIAIPFHTITGAMWGINLARRECNKETRLNWFRLGFVQVLFHGCYDFIEMEYALYTVTSDVALEIGYVFLGIFIALVITISAGLYAYFCMYKRAKQVSAELIPDEYQANMDFA